MLREEGHHRRDTAHRLHERVPQRSERGLVERVEAAARAADVPVRDVVDEALERAHDVRRPVPVVGALDLGEVGLRPREQPPIERAELRALRAGVEIAERRPEALDVRVRREEHDRVPEREQPALDLARGGVAEPHALGRRLFAVHPAHDVGTHPLDCLVRLDRVALRAVHLVAVLVAHVFVPEHPLVGRPPVEDDRHEEQRVEPQPDLLAHLDHPVRGKPLLPVRVVGKVGGREPRRGAGCVAAFDPLGALPAERGEGDDAGVEPHVPDLGDALHLGPALLARDHDLVDPGPMELLELLEPTTARAPRAPASSPPPSSARSRTGRRAAAGRSTASGRCSSRPCSGASRPCACRRSRASSPRTRSPRAAWGGARPPR